MELPWCPLYVLPCLVLLSGSTHAQLADLNPADFGLNCTIGEFVNLYLTCLFAYKGSDAIQNCKVQCSVLDEVTDCVGGMPPGAMSRECLTSMAAVMVTVPSRLKELLFDFDELDSCGIEVDSVLTVCPDLPSLLLPEWSPWGAFGDCTEKCTEVRSRECLNVLSFRPPETTEACDGESSESQPCTPCIATTASDQGTPPAAGTASSLWQVADYVLQGGAIIVLSRSLLWADVML